MSKMKPAAWGWIGLGVFVAFLFLRPHLGFREPGSGFEKQSGYTVEVMVNLFPDGAEAKNYRLPAKLHALEGEYYLEQVRFPNGGVVSFESDAINLYEQSGVHDTQGRYWRVEVLRDTSKPAEEKTFSPVIKSTIQTPPKDDGTTNKRFLELAPALDPFANVLVKKGSGDVVFFLGKGKSGPIIFEEHPWREVADPITPGGKMLVSQLDDTVRIRERMDNYEWMVIYKVRESLAARYGTK